MGMEYKSAVKIMDDVVKHYLDYLSYRDDDPKAIPTVKYYGKGLMPTRSPRHTAVFVMDNKLVLQLT